MKIKVSMKAKLIKKDDGYNLTTEQPQGRLLEATCSPSQQLILDKSGASTKYKLSKQNCDEIFGVVDVDKLAYQSTEEVLPHHGDYRFKNVYEEYFRDGFNKAMELNKDKVFTINDVRNAMDWIMTQYYEFHEQPTTGRREQYLESIQQPTEIEVEIEMDSVPADRAPNGWSTFPKLDSEGYLILKRVG